VEPRYFAHWPSDMPRSLTLPPLRLHDLLARAASRFPDKAAHRDPGPRVRGARRVAPFPAGLTSSKGL